MAPSKSLLAQEANARKCHHMRKYLAKPVSLVLCTDVQEKSPLGFQVIQAQLHFFMLKLVFFLTFLNVVQIQG